MLKNYFKIAFRSLSKNKLFTAINVLGLSLGLASAGVLILFIQRGITFDTFHKDHDRIYFVQTSDVEGRYSQTVYPILEQLVKTYPEIETGTHVQGWNNVWLNYKGKDLQKNTKYVDSTFFDVFSFKLKYGNAATALKRKQSIVLSEQVAEARGLTSQQYQALLAIEGEDGEAPITVTLLAQRLLIKHNSAVELVDRLVAEDLVVREASRADRRKVELRLTARGREVLAKLAAVHRAELRRVGPVLKAFFAELSRPRR